MARFLFTVWPFSGHIHPTIAVAHALQQADHEVAFYTGSSARAVVEGQGFRCFVMTEVDESVVNRIVLSPDGILAQRRNPLRLKALWREWTLDTIPGQVADLQAIVADWKPDTIVCDPTMWGPFLILHELLNIPVAIFALTPSCQLPGRDGPIHGFSLPRPRTALERLRANMLRHIVSITVADVRRGANALRQRYKLAPLRVSVTAYAGQMPLYLVPGSPEFDYQRDDLPSSVHYVGACQWSKPSAQSPDQWLTDLPHDQPIVYVTEGTIHLQPRILKAAAQGLANQPVRVIMTTGTHRDPDALDLGPRPLAPNIIVKQWVPLEDLLRHVDAVVTTGGSNTVQATLVAGLPLIVVPRDWDHPDSGWRVQDAGAGLMLNPDRCTPERLGAAVMRVLTEGSFRTNARRLGASFERCGGPPKAAALLAQLVRDHHIPELNAATV